MNSIGSVNGIGSVWNTYKKVEAKQYGEYASLPAGGYVCKILKAEYTQSKNLRPMIVFSMDVALGDFAGHFQKLYTSNTFDDKKWKCMYRQLVDESGMPYFKGLISNIEQSNAGYNFEALNYNLESLTNKMVGVIFRYEEYQASDGSIKTSAKPLCSTTVLKINTNDFVVPGVKKIAITTPQQTYNYAAPKAGYTTEPVNDEYDLPF